MIKCVVPIASILFKQYVWGDLRYPEDHVSYTAFFAVVLSGYPRKYAILQMQFFSCSSLGQGGQNIVALRGIKIFLESLFEICLVTAYI